MAPRSKQRKTAGAHVTTSAAGLLSEISRLKKQAERREGGAARQPLLEECARLLGQVLTLPSPSGVEDEALFELGDVYSLWASSVKVGMYAAVGCIVKGYMKKIDALNLQVKFLLHAADLYRQSHEVFEKIASRGACEFKIDAAINSGNALCDWADLLIEVPAESGGGESAAANLYMQADCRYSTVLSSTTDDVELLANFGDCNIKRAELAFSVGSTSAAEPSDPWTKAKEFYERAMRAFEDAYSKADSSKGDDVAGLLQNWGAGFLSLAERTPDIVEATVVFKQAQDKLRTAAKFSTTDASIFIALGETFSTQAEKLGRDPQLQSEALNMLECAIGEGFGTALKIDATCLDAIIGMGEAHLMAAKLMSCIGMPSLAEEHFIHSFNSYMKALEVLKTDGGNNCRLKFEQQCDVLFDLACAAARCNQEAVAAEALRQLMQVDGLSTTELALDSDFESLKTKEWFLALLQG